MPTPVPTNNSTGVPALNVPFVSNNGVIGLPWYRFLINLWNRTGGSSSNIFYLNIPPSGPGQIPIYDGSFWDARSITGDASLAGNGHITVTSTDGVHFAASATTDTTNANNITAGVLGSAFGGTGVDNGSNTITLAGSLTTSGAHPLHLTLTGTTNVTLPTSGTLLGDTLLSGDIFVGNASNQATAATMSGDATLSNTGAITLATVNPDVGSFTNPNVTVNAKGLIIAITNGPAGISVTITTAKLTGGGTNGSMTFTNGILTAETPAT